eukprot:1809942-Alexandrium_andersonii.AAC.1
MSGGLPLASGPGGPADIDLTAPLPGPLSAESAKPAECSAATPVRAEETAANAGRPSQAMLLRE